MKKTLYLFLLNAFVLYAVDYNVSTFDDFLAKLNSMTADDTIILNNNIESNNNRDLTPLNLKGTIRGNGHTLHIESKPVVLAGNTKLDNINLTIKPATPTTADGIAAGFDQTIFDEEPKIVMNGHDLTLHNVVSNMDAKHGKNAHKVKPYVIMGDNGENNSSGSDRENKLTITGEKELAISGILTGSLGKLKTSKSTIDIQNSNAKLKDNSPPIKLGSISTGHEGTYLNNTSEEGAVEIKTNSASINNFEQNGKNNVTMEVNSVNFDPKSKLPHTLQNLRLNGTSEFKTKNLTVDELHIEDNSKILIEPQPNVQNTGKLNIKTLNGNGTIETRNGFDDPASVTIEKITGNPKVIAVDNEESKLTLPAGYERTSNGEVRRKEESRDPNLGRSDENAEQPPVPAPEDSENENDGDSATGNQDGTVNNNDSDTSSTGEDSNTEDSAKDTETEETPDNGATDSTTENPSGTTTDDNSDTTVSTGDTSEKPKSEEENPSSESEPSGSNGATDEPTGNSNDNNDEITPNTNPAGDSSSNSDTTKPNENAEENAGGADSSDRPKDNENTAQPTPNNGDIGESENQPANPNEGNSSETEEKPLEGTDQPSTSGEANPDEEGATDTPDNQGGSATNNNSSTTDSTGTGEDSNTEDSAKDTEIEEEQGENASDSQDETSDKENQDDKSNNPSDEATDTVENNDIEAKKVEQKYEDFKNLGTKIKANVNLKLVEDSSYLLPAMASYSNQLLADRIKRNIEEINKLETSDNIWVKTPSTRGRLYKDIKYSDNTVLVGAEKASSDNLKVGFAVGIGEGKEKLENSKFNHNNKINTTEFYHYGEYEKNNNKLSYQLGLGFAKTKTQRKIANNNVFAKYNSNVFSTGIGYSYKYDFKNISVEPTLNLNYVLVKSNSYKENGNSPYKLNVQKNNYNDMNLKTAIRAVWNHNKFSASIETGLTFNLLKNKENLSYTLVEDESVKLNLENYKKEQVHGNVALGVGYKVTENAQVFLKYETKVSKHNKSQSGMIGFKYTF